MGCEASGYRVKERVLAWQRNLKRADWSQQMDPASDGLLQVDTTWLCEQRGDWDSILFNVVRDADFLCCFLLKNVLSPPPVFSRFLEREWNESNKAGKRYWLFFSLLIRKNYRSKPFYELRYPIYSFCFNPPPVVSRVWGLEKETTGDGDSVFSGCKRMAVFKFRIFSI